jgi:hypothetical protein
MAFSDYRNMAEVQKQFQIKYQEEDFLMAQELELSEHFISELIFNQKNIDVYTSEAARSEAIIFPILREVYKKYVAQYTLWIQKKLVYNKELSGTPDYMIATRSALGKTVLEIPLLIVVEAKKNDFEQGWGQCLAELVAAQKLNGNSEQAVYGIVTDGKLWELGQLRATTFTKNMTSYTVDNLARLCGVLQYVFDMATGAIEERNSDET